MGGIDLTDEESRDVVWKWRDIYRPIYQGWTQCDVTIRAMINKTHYSPDPRGLVKTDDSGNLVLPSGRTLYYPRIRHEQVEEETDVGTVVRNRIRYGVGKNVSFIGGTMLCENIVQAIARDVIAWQAYEIYKRTGHRPALTVHDELVYVVDEDKAEDHLAKINAMMRVAPAWLPGIVLWSEGDVADSYGEAKS